MGLPGSGSSSWGQPGPESTDEAWLDYRRGLVRSAQRLACSAQCPLLNRCDDVTAPGNQSHQPGGSNQLISHKDALVRAQYRRLRARMPLGKTLDRVRLPIAGWARDTPPSRGPRCCRGSPTRPIRRGVLRDRCVSTCQAQLSARMPSCLHYVAPPRERGSDSLRGPLRR